MDNLISQQEKQGMDFDFKKSMNEISKLVREAKYTQPYSHKHLLSAIEAEFAFDDNVHDEIKKLSNQNQFQAIRDKYTDQQLVANRYGYMVDDFKEMGID